MQVCLEYFARHFNVNLLVHTPIVAPSVLSFPNFLDRGEAQPALVSDFRRRSAGTIVRIAHVPVVDNPDARPVHYVPVWRRQIQYTPVLSEVIFYCMYSHAWACRIGMFASNPNRN